MMEKKERDKETKKKENEPNGNFRFGFPNLEKEMH